MASMRDIKCKHVQESEQYAADVAVYIEWISPSSGRVFVPHSCCLFSATAAQVRLARKKMEKRARDVSLLS